MSALLEFHKRPTPRWLLYGPVIIAFLVFFIYIREPRARLAFSGLAFGLAQLVTGAALLHYRIAAEQRTRWLLGRKLLPDGGRAAVARVHRVVRARDDPARRSGTSAAPGPALLAFYAVTIASSFAFLLMHKERADRETYELATTDSLTGVYNRRTFRSSPTRSSRAAAARACRCRCSCSTSTTSSASTTPTAISPATTC